MKGQCPRPLDDGDIGTFLQSGGAREDRTPDLNTASVALSQLSYGPKNEGEILVKEGVFVQYFSYFVTNMRRIIVIHLQSPPYKAFTLFFTYNERL